MHYALSLTLAVLFSDPVHPVRLPGNPIVHAGI